MVCSRSVRTQGLGFRPLCDGAYFASLCSANLREVLVIGSTVTPMFSSATTPRRLGVGTEDHLHHGLLPHQSAKPYSYSTGSPFARYTAEPDPCGAQAVGRTETIHRPRVDQKIRLVWRSAAGKIAHLRGNVGQTHAKGIRGSQFAVNRRLVPAPVSRCSGWGAVIWELGAILDTAELADVRVCSVLQWQGEPMNSSESGYSDSPARSLCDATGQKDRCAAIARETA